MVVSDRQLHVTGHIVGLAGAIVWLVPLLGGLASGEPVEDGSFVESAGVVVLAIANIAAVVLAIRNVWLGARALLVTGALFAIFSFFAAGRNEWFAVIASGGPFLASATLHLVAEVVGGRRLAERLSTGRPHR